MFFFFKQKTAYEMRISDWSSDVCSSDLDGIFERLASALGKILGHRVRGIAKQGCPAHCPMFDRVTVRCCPSPPGSRSIEHLVRQRVYTFEIGQYFIAAAIGDTPFLLLAAVEGNDKIVLPTAAQRIMDKVAMRSEEHTSELQSLMRISYAVICFKKKKKT